MYSLVEITFARIRAIVMAAATNYGVRCLPVWGNFESRNAVTCPGGQREGEREREREREGQASKWQPERNGTQRNVCGCAFVCV